MVGLRERFRGHTPSVLAGSDSWYVAFGIVVGKRVLHAFNKLESLERKGTVSRVRFVFGDAVDWRFWKCVQHREGFRGVIYENTKN